MESSRRNAGHIVGYSEDVRILDSARYVLPSKVKKPEYGGADTIRRMTQVLADLASVEDAPEGYAALVAVPNIDAGEGILIGHAASNECAYLTTGDKRCLKALTSPELQDFFARLSGKVVCVETAIESLI